MARWHRFSAGALLVAGLAVAPGGFAAAAAAPPSPGAGDTPAGVYVSAQENDVFYTATGGTVWVKNLDGGAVTQVSNGRLIGGPSAIYNESTVIVFGEGTDHALWWTTREANGQYANWTRLGGVLTSAPAAVYTGAASDPADYYADYSVFVRGSNGALYELDHSDSGWAAAFSDVGGQLLAGTGPAAVWVTTPASPSSIIYVLVAGTNRAMYLSALGLYGFTDVGGQTTSTPALAGVSGPKVWAFCRGTDNAGWYDGVVLTEPGGWTSLGGRFTSGLAATTDSAGQSFVFGLGTDSQAYQRTANLNDDPPVFSAGWTRVTG